MTASLGAAHYADQATHETVALIGNQRLARDTYRMRIECPEIAARIVPGQFVMVRLAGFDDPLLGRPLALYDTILNAEGRPTSIDLVYLVVGKLTGKLAALLPGSRLEVWGPLGNGFQPAAGGHLCMVAGGIGQTPFVALAAESLGRRQYGEPSRPVVPARRVTLCYGARSAEYLAGLPDFDRAGAEVRICTEDGTLGRRGLVTDELRALLAEQDRPTHIACCGPEPMMEAVAEIASAAKLPCAVSLESPMACGIGICFSCVTRVRQSDGSWDYKRTCVEGPVFSADEIVW